MAESLLIQNGNVVTPVGTRCLDVLIIDSKIVQVGPDITAPGVLSLDAAGALVGPGFFDIHTHGGVGVDMNDIDRARLEAVSVFFAAQGVTGFLPTLLTDTKEQLIACLRVLREAIENPLSGARILGIHLEGPHLCPEYKGAMPEHLLTLPSVEEFSLYQEASGGNVLRVTVSPELTGSERYITELAKMGVKVSIGHSGADYDCAMAAIRAGAVSATHTGNAMKLLHQHFPAILGAVLESDIYCEAIPDGIHLHPGIVRLLLKCKGKNRVVAVTDSIMAAGLGDGEYRLGVNEIVVENGDAKLKQGGSRAGSTLTMCRALKNLAAFTNQPPAECWGLLSENPAALCGLGDTKGALIPGLDGDITILAEDSLKVLCTIVGGEIVYGGECGR